MLSRITVLFAPEFPPDALNRCLSPAKEWSVQGLIDLIDIGLFEPERRFERSKSDSISGLRPWSSPTAVEPRFTTHNGLVPVFVRLITRGGTWVPSRATIYQLRGKGGMGQLTSAFSFYLEVPISK